MGLPFFEKRKKDAPMPQKQEPQTASSLVLREEAKDVENTVHGTSGLQRPRVARKFPVLEHSVLLRPVMSAKAFSKGRERYIFEVSKTAGKVEIRKAFYNMYGVMPKTVRTQRYGSREIRFGRIRGRSKEWKKAIITLKKGETVHLV